MGESAIEPSEAVGLGGKKELAFGALREGRTFAEAAQTAGVGRATVYRWLQSDPKFRARYNAWQAEMVDSARSRVLALMDRAVDVVEGALDREDERVAVRVLRDLGIARRLRTGSTDAKVVEMQMQLERKKAQLQATEGMVRLLLGKAGYTPAEQRQFIHENGIVDLDEVHRRTAALEATNPPQGDPLEAPPAIPPTDGSTDEKPAETNARLSQAAEQVGAT